MKAHQIMLGRDIRDLIPKDKLAEKEFTATVELAGGLKLTVDHKNGEPVAYRGNGPSGEPLGTFALRLMDDTGGTGTGGGTTGGVDVSCWMCITGSDGKSLCVKIKCPPINEL